MQHLLLGDKQDLGRLVLGRDPLVFGQALVDRPLEGEGGEEVLTNEWCSNSPTAKTMCRSKTIPPRPY
jgi:hypothetical protein